MKKNVNFFNRWQYLFAMIAFVAFSALLLSPAWATTMGDAFDYDAEQAIKAPTGYSRLSVRDADSRLLQAIETFNFADVTSMTTDSLFDATATLNDYSDLNPATLIVDLNEENSLQANPSWITQANTFNFADVNSKKTYGSYDVYAYILGTENPTETAGTIVNYTYVSTGQPVLLDLAAMYYASNTPYFGNEMTADLQFRLSVLRTLTSAPTQVAAISVLKMPNLSVLTGSHNAAVIIS